MDAFLEEYYRRNDPKTLKDCGDKYKMSMLSDKTILKIFDTMSIREQLDLSDSSDRLAKLFEIYGTEKYKVFDMKTLKDMHPKLVTRFFKKVGYLIRTLIGIITYHKREETISYIVNYTTKIKTLRLWHSEVKVDNLHHMFLNNNSLIQHLSLVNCNLNDYSIVPILQLRALRSLSIAYNKGITGKYLSELRGLHLLDICGCVFFEAEKLLEIARLVYYLRVLNIQDCHCVDESLIDSLGTCALALEKLIITANTSEIYKALPKLRPVTKFEIKCIEPPEPSFFKHLVSKKREVLESLVLRQNSGLTTETIKILSSLENLREIYLGARCIYDKCGLKPFRKLGYLERIVIKNCICLNNEDVLFLIDHCTQLTELRIIKCPTVTALFFEPIMDRIKRSLKHQIYKCSCGLTLGISTLNSQNHTCKYIYNNCDCDMFPVDDDFTKISNTIN
ncbi:uncharacterized protein LOC119662420 [Teleopsis dalmanni]|uniref:uncharacterized protein LOC119662420 n=1 Tax=Teleopsis dalmanni TaxID=139649 RepID=UPI0018CD29C7|nr:uncharacterized protein LOC119662420 [Teleopsis dalmanni]